MEPNHTPTSEATFHPKNKAKNRYTNITACKQSDWVGRTARGGGSKGRGRGEGEEDEGGGVVWGKE